MRAQPRMEQAAARYRQTVLAAFQSGRGPADASRVLQQQLALRQQAADAANLVEQQVLNRYQAGQVSYTDVITAQVHRAQCPARGGARRSGPPTAAVSLIQALGGWRGL